MAKGEAFAVSSLMTEAPVLRTIQLSSEDLIRLNRTLSSGGVFTITGDDCIIEIKQRASSWVKGEVPVLE
jgi:hypothetical protein